MAQEGEATTLSEQLLLAKDMGYTDDEITQAVSMNCAKDGSYRSFSSTNAMIDILSRVQKMCESSETSSLLNNNNTGDSGLELDVSSSSPPRTPTARVRRTISFHSVSSPNQKSHDDPMSSSAYEMRYRGNNFQLQRLLDAFDKERKSFNDESTRSIKLLEEKCRQLADKEVSLTSILKKKDQEIQSLKAQLYDQNQMSEELKQTRVRLDNQIIESYSKSEQLRCLQNEYDDEKKKYQTERRLEEQRVTDLRNKLTKAEESLKSKQEICSDLEKQVEELKRVANHQKTELDKCKNYHDEILKAEQFAEEMRIERDKFRSTLSNVPTCVICLDKMPQMLYRPCSHLICCESCGSGLENCPTCRQKICDKITVYQ